MESNATPLQKLQEHIHSLAPVVDWLRDHPELNDLGVAWSSPNTIGLYAYGSAFPMAVRALKDGAPLGTIHRTDDEHFTHFERDFGGVKVYAYTSRSEVCERVVVGTETVEIPDPDAPTITVEREVVRWECRPVLADAVTDKAVNDLDIEDWAVRS